MGALFLRFVLALGWLGREQGVPRTGWLLIGGALLVGVLLVVSVRCARPVVEPGKIAPPGEVVCRELVDLVTDLLDGVLAPGWREGVEAHLADCDGCTEYVRQIRATFEALGALPLTRKLPALRTGRAGIAPERFLAGRNPPVCRLRMRRRPDCGLKLKGSTLTYGALRS